MRIERPCVNGNAGIRPDFSPSCIDVFWARQASFTLVYSVSIRKASYFCGLDVDGFTVKKRNRNELVTTDTELMAMAAPASIGESAGPPNR